MDFRHIFFLFFFFLFLYPEVWKNTREKKNKTERSVIHDKVVKKCLIPRKEACHLLSFLKQLFNYLYLLKRLLKVQ